ncbi:MAG: protein translocase subunit SecD [Spirochaetaceae bacterium]|jgi:preprotein translocase subunit SecD|nr:protein translocase subunit SecD [Spirochaetaceae bacterium]
MSKRYRLAVIILVISICAVFLSSTVEWYFFTPAQDKQLALASREQIKSYASRTASYDIQKLIAAARAGEPVPENLNFLINEAKKINAREKAENPAVWDAASVLRVFYDKREALDAIEGRYRQRLFDLKDLQKNAVQLGLDLSGGLSIILQADMDSYARKLGRTLTEEDRRLALDQALEVLNGRIDRFGLTEPVIRRQGDGQIYIEIPGTADPERINSIIMGKGGLAFHMVDQEATEAFFQYYANHPDTTFNEDGSLVNPSIIPDDCVVRGVYTKDRYGLDEQKTGRDAWVALKKEIGLDGNHIKNATVSRDNIDGKPEVTFELTAEGADVFYNLTSNNLRKPLATVLDDKVRSVATIQSAIRDSGRLTGFSMEESSNIALILRSAALPVELEIVNQQSIGPSLGADTIKQGLWALCGGLIFVFIFMLVFYKSAGINAVLAQILNIYIMFSILSAFNFTLTLPSIAGFILTIGMAVDASVIVFERMKEELRLGKGRKSAIEFGFSKAFWAVMDANITTFIAALFLSQLGSGPIQGFAVSLAIGVFSSVFTSLFVSRLIFDFGTDVLKSKTLSVSWRIRG